MYSEVGTGTTLKIYLPRVEQTFELPDLGAAPAELLRGSETVLLVEDDEKVRALVQVLLERHGYMVIAAKQGQDALRVAQDSTTTIDLLLTDTIMPGMSGTELAHQVLALRPAIKVLYMSGYTDKAVWEPGFAFLQKPFTPQTLTRKVHDILNADSQPSSTE